MTNLAVVIPYFQRDEGILRRAVDSILAQTLPEGLSVEIVIVDDGSPSPAKADISDLEIAPPFKLTLIEQKNGGCAAARDTGLKHIGESTDFIAFLDSDDWWTPGHIATAVAAFGKGYDIYFSDHGRVGHHPSHFALIDFPRSDAPAGAFTQIEGEVWDIDKDYFFGFFLRKFTAQISTFVYRRSISPQAAFRLALRSAGEDYLFMLELIQRAKKICFSKNRDSICGDGVNVYYSTYDWDDEGHMRRYMGDILGAYVFSSALKLGAVDKRVIDDRITNCRRTFAFFTLRWFLKRRGAWSAKLRALTRSDPNFRVWYPLCLAYVAVSYPLKLYRPPE